MGQRPLGRRPDRPQRMAPAGLPYAHRLSSPYNDAARPERLGAVLATSDRPAIAMCICTAALSPVLRASTTKKINISCEQHIFFS